MEARKCGTAYILHIALPLKVTDTHRYRSPHTVVHHEGELRNGQHYLMGCQSDGTQPTHHNGAKAERSRLHSHLQADRPAQRIEPLKHRKRPPHAEKPKPVTNEATTAKYNQRENHDHHNTREQRTDTCSQQTQLRKAQLTVDKNIITYDVQRVSAQQYPHGGLGVGDTVRKLLETIEQHHENQRSEQYQIIRFYQRHQFLGLPQTLHIEVDHRHDESKKQSHQDIRHQTAPQRLPRFRKTAVAVKTAYNRRQSVAETGTENDAKRKYVVYERSRTQFLGTVMPNHQGIRETENNYAHLPDNNGKSQKYQRFIMLFIAGYQIHHLII